MAAWWEAGLPFACTQSGKCCHARNGYAHVHLSRREQLHLARHLGLKLSEFLERYTEQDADGHVGLRFPSGQCVFLEGKSCSVHAAKPVQCRTWPFWPELLRSRAIYDREVRAYCPGSRAGPIVSGASIARQLRETEDVDETESREADGRD